jgi:hypothetical protein
VDRDQISARDCVAVAGEEGALALAALGVDLACFDAINTTLPTCLVTSGM